MSHGGSKTDEKVKPLGGRLLERQATTGRGQRAQWLAVQSYVDSMLMCKSGHLSSAIATSLAPHFDVRATANWPSGEKEFWYVSSRRTYR